MLGNTDASETAALLVGLATPPAISSPSLAAEVVGLFGGDCEVPVARDGCGVLSSLVAGYSHHDHLFAAVERGDTVQGPPATPATTDRGKSKRGGGAAAADTKPAPREAHSSPPSSPVRDRRRGRGGLVVVVTDSESSGTENATHTAPPPLERMPQPSTPVQVPEPAQPRRRPPTTVVDSDSDSDGDGDAPASARAPEVAAPLPASPPPSPAWAPPRVPDTAMSAVGHDIPDSFAPDADLFAWGEEAQHDTPPATPVAAAAMPLTGSVCARHAAACARIGVDLSTLRACTCSLTPTSVDLVEYALTSLWDEVRGGLSARVMEPAPGGDENAAPAADGGGCSVYADAWETLEAALALADAEPRLHLAAAQLGRRAGWITTTV